MLALVAVLAFLAVVAVGRALLPPDPEEWFTEHRADYEAAAAWALEQGCCTTYYGLRLPESLQHLSETGKVSGEAPWEGSSEERALFFPQWLGIPDDAGGYWHSPSSSPAGLDMYGMPCQRPTTLGEGWWMCGL